MFDTVAIFFPPNIFNLAGWSEDAEPTDKEHWLYCVYLIIEKIK